MISGPANILDWLEPTQEFLIRQQKIKNLRNSEARYRGFNRYETILMLKQWRPTQEKMSHFNPVLESMKGSNILPADSGRVQRSAVRLGLTLDLFVWLKFLLSTFHIISDENRNLSAEVENWEL